MMEEPLAFVITWATYGTLLPGDKRGWVEYHHGWQFPDPVRELESAAKMTEDACRLTPEQRAAVVRAATTYLGRPYDLHFAPGDDHIYCSELVVLAYAAVGLQLGSSTPAAQLGLHSPPVPALLP